MLLSDGEAPRDGLVELVEDMHFAKMTVSAIGILGADRNLLSMIADAGDGRVYIVEDITALPKVFLKEVREGLR